MADISVRRLAEKLNSKPEDLVVQLRRSGLQKTTEDSLTEQESKSFLDFLTNKEGKGDSKPKTLSLKSRRSSEELVTDSTGRKRTVTVVRRKERVVQKKTSLITEVPVVEPELAPEVIEQGLHGANVSIGSNIDSVLGDKIEASSIYSEKNLEADLEKNLEKEPEKELEKESGKDSPKDSEKDKKKGKKRQQDTKLSDSEDPSAARLSKPISKLKRTETDSQWDSKKALDALTSEDDLDDSSATLANVTTNYVSNHSYGKSSRRFERKSSSNTVKHIDSKHGFSLPSQPMVYEVSITEGVTVAELAQRMAMKSGKLIKTLMQMGHMATINQVLDQDTAVLVVEELGHTAKIVKDNALEENLVTEFSEKFKDAKELPRAPVVTIMGHVDHGKTSLLDYIRTTKVTDKEAGGITQHIGAYSVNTGHGKITFLDTPGHAAFSAMRARGANVTDVVILVVSADDGVMPQTIEAIQHAKAAGVPIVVAINKMDKKDADPERVKNELVQHGVIPEEWGGENQFVAVSAKTGEGIDNLLNAILVQTEILELKAAIDVPFKGIVIESRLDKGRGVVTTVLVQRGTMHKGDIILAGSEYGRIRAMIDAAMHRVETAGPSDPVEIIGLSAAPKAGDEVVAVATERQAREVAMYRQSKMRSEKYTKLSENNLDDLFSKAKDSDVAILNVIIKADVQGSTEAIVGSLDKLSTQEVRVKIIGSGVGGINESDITLAMASKAIVIGFNVRADQSAKRLADNEGIRVIYDSIIYNVIDDVKQILSGMLSPEIREEIIGLAEVRDVFRSSKIGAIAGCMVIDGVVKRHSPIRVLRDNIVIYEGELESLRRFKDDVNEVKNNTECGIGVKNYNDVKPGDQIEVFKRVEISRKLD
jgi:translation initiation factor IF-2